MPIESKPFILSNKSYEEQSVFLPENLLREARRQKGIKECKVPEICVLDPDGDLVDYLLQTQVAKKSNCWACYHSKLYNIQVGNIEIGIVPCIVGASYAVLVAEQLFVSGCKYLISVTSAGIIKQPTTDKRFALIKEALRDEGTSYHYLDKDASAHIQDKLYLKISEGSNDSCSWFDAISWTTDAPYRETTSAISIMESYDVTCVEMEAAALYAFGLAKKKDVVCFAHLTNTMAQQTGDFEKGAHFGSIDTLNLINEVTNRLGYK
jgi:purine-nucleoside phosphorylase